MSCSGCGGNWTNSSAWQAAPTARPRAYWARGSKPSCQRTACARLAARSSGVVGPSPGRAGTAARTGKCDCAVLLRATTTRCQPSAGDRGAACASPWRHFLRRPWRRGSGRDPGCLGGAPRRAPRRLTGAAGALGLLWRAHGRRPPDPRFRATARGRRPSEPCTRHGAARCKAPCQRCRGHAEVD